MVHAEGSTQAICLYQVRDGETVHIVRQDHGYVMVVQCHAFRNEMSNRRLLRQLSQYVSKSPCVYDSK
jgi:hypothetical protein